jgi:hypothetical protein
MSDESAAVAAKQAIAGIFDTSEGLRALLADAGFTDVVLTPETARFVYADEAAWWDSLWSHGMRGWLEAVGREQGSETLQRFKQATFAELKPHREADGCPQSSSVLFGVASRPA